MGEKRQPVVFVGHGSPLNAIADNDIRRGWQEMGKRLGRPRAILAVSAHWFTYGRWVRTAAHNPQINDMYGFPDELYAVHYAPAGAPDVAARRARGCAPARHSAAGSDRATAAARRGWAGPAHGWRVPESADR